MPVVVTFIAALVQSGSVITALQAIGFSAFGAALLGYGTLAAVAYSQAQRAKRKMRDAYNASLKDRLVTTAMADAARVRVYGGPVRVGGYVVYKEVAGAKSENYTLVVIFAGHQLESIDDIYVGDVKVTLNSSGLVTTAPWGARSDRKHETYSITATGTSTTIDFNDVAESVTVTYEDAKGKKQQATITGQTSSTVTFNSTIGVTYTADYNVTRVKSYMVVRKFLGGDDQDIHALVSDPAYGAFVNSQITASDKFAGMAGVVVSCAFDTTAFPGGVPSITAVVKGCNTVYDPRTATTGWTDNPALCARDWALYANGGGCIAAELDDASFIAAANACDTSHTYTDSEAVSTATKLYRCGYVASLDQDPETHLSELVEAMAGRWMWSGGRLRVKAGVYSSPLAVTIDESWLAGGVAIDRGLDLEETVNIYRPTIADQAQDFVPVPLPELRIQSYIDDDGVELPVDLAITAVTFAPQAMHICGVQARDARWGRTYRLLCNMKAFQLEGLDVVRLTLPRYNATNKPVEVVGWAFVPPAQVQLVLKETDASIYQPDATFEVDIPTSNDALPKPWQVPEIVLSEPDSGESHLLQQADGSIVTRVLVSYAPILDQAVLSDGKIEVSYSVSGSGVWESVSFDGDAPFVYLQGLSDGQLYQIRARLRNRLAVGSWSPLKVHRVTGKSSPPPAPDVFTVRAMPDGTRLLEGGYTTTARPLDFMGWRIKYRQGAGPYVLADLQPFQTDNNGTITALPLETNLLTAGTWTLALLGVDTSGNESDPLIITGTLPNPRLGDALLYLSMESLGFPGTLTDCVRDTFEGAPVLTARDQNTWDDLTSWDAWTRWAFDPVTTWTYQLADEDLGAVVSTLPVVDLVGVGAFVTEEQHSTDGTTWSSWAAIAGSVLARYVRIRVTVTATGATGPGVTQYTYISAMRVVYTAAVTTEVLEDISPAALTGSYRIGTGDIRLPLTGSYATVRVESLVIQSSAASAWTWQLVDKNTSPGPRVQFFNAGVLADPPLIDATLKGISL